MEPSILWSALATPAKPWIWQTHSNKKYCKLGAATGSLRSVRDSNAKSAESFQEQGRRRQPFALSAPRGDFWLPRSERRGEKHFDQDAARPCETQRRRSVRV